MNYRILIFMCLVINNIVFGRRTKIVGGDITEIEEFPYLVSLRYIDTNNLRCGGAIISNQHVLTAAHCVLDVSCKNLLIYAGTSNSLSTIGPKYKIKRYKVHPNYIGEMENVFKDDIAVIMIKGFFVLDEVQKIAELPTTNVQGGEKAFISGWGKLGYAFLDTSINLRKAPMTILKNEECWNILPFTIHDEQLCAFERPGVGACVGDSGGPLIYNGIVVGIASFVLPCAEGVPDIYTRVYKYIDFIEKEMSYSPSDYCICQ